MPMRYFSHSHAENKEYHTPLSDRFFQVDLLENDELEVIHFQLEEAMEMMRPVMVVYTFRARKRQFFGYVVKNDPFEGWIIMECGERRKRIPYWGVREVQWF